MSLKLNSSGGGSITLQEPSTASNRTLTLPDNTGILISSADSGTVTQGMIANGVAGKGPAFSAYANAIQGVSSATQTVLVFGVEEFDTDSRFNNTGSTVSGIPAYAFMPNVAGYYQVNWFVITDAIATTSELFSRLLKNGSNYAWSVNLTPSGSHYNAVSGSALVYLNGTTDYIQAALFQNTGSNLNTKVDAGEYRFSAAMVRAA